MYIMCGSLSQNKLSKSKSINGGKMMLKKKTMGHEKGWFGLIQNCLNG